MNEKEIRRAVRVIRTGVEGAAEEELTAEEREGLDAILDAGEALVSEFFCNQSRIAEALERIANMKDRL